MKPVPPADMKSGFFSPYIIVPKKSSGLRPILGLRILNWAFHKLPFKMLTQKRIFGCIRPEIGLKWSTWRTRTSMCRSFRATGHSCGLRSKDGHISYNVLPFRLSLSPHVFTKVAEAALVPLREQGVCILKYIDHTLILAQFQDQIYEHRDLVLSHLSQLVQGQLGKEQTLPDAEDLFSWYGVRFGQSDSAPHAGMGSVLNCLNTFKSRTAAPLKQFQRLLGHMTAAAAVTSLGLLHMRPLQHWLHGRIPRWTWQRGTLRVRVTPGQTFTLWSELSFLRAGVPLEQVSRQAVVYTDAFAKGWGGHIQRACSVWSLDGSPTALAHQLIRVAGSIPGLKPSQEALMRRPGFPLVPSEPGSEPASTAPGGGRPSPSFACPVRALRCYVDRTQSFRTSD